MEDVIDIGIKGKALCSFKDGSLLVYRKGSFYLFQPDKKKQLNQFTLPIHQTKKILCHFRLLERLLHTEPRWAIPIDNDNVYIFFEGKMYRVNARSGKFTEEQLPVRGKPLTIIKIKAINGFSDSFALGDYGQNNNREEVRIYQKHSGTSEWRIACSFPKGTVRHIHALVPDPLRNRILILTGDEDLESGIWAAYNDFSKIEPVLVGKQKYRTCQAIPYKDRIYFLSDKPSEENYLWIIDEKDKEILQTEAIRGSCIYGRVVGERGIFSTTCEPEAHAKNKVDYWLSTRPGKGVKDNKIDIILIENGELSVISTFQSDGMPLRLFQYATATFAYSSDDKIYFTPQCVKRYDMHVFMLNKD